MVPAARQQATPGSSWAGWAGPISSANTDSGSAERGLAQHRQDGAGLQLRRSGANKGARGGRPSSSPRKAAHLSLPHMSPALQTLGQHPRGVPASERVSLCMGLLRGCLGFQVPFISLCGARAPLSFRGASAAHPLSWRPTAIRRQRAGARPAHFMSPPLRLVSRWLSLYVLG